MVRTTIALATALLFSSSAAAQLLSFGPGSFSADAVRAQITGGPWTLGVDAGYPAPTIGSSNFEPDYQPQVYVGPGGTLQGLFDYRPEELEESVLAASSPDGVSWTFESEALDFADAGSDDGQGHPFALAVGDQLFLYTLDRTAGAIDSAGLRINALNPTAATPLAGLPATQVPIPLPDAGARTVGLLNPDGIIGVVPGSNPVEILYVQKELAIANGADLTFVRLATTTDGVNFTDLGAVSGLIDPCTATPSTCVTSQSVTYIASRGTLLAITDAQGTTQGYGLIFSAGLWGGDSDAYDYIGYAESTDLTTWTVYNGLDGAPSLPLISTAGNDLTPTGQRTQTPLDWYQARAYAPSAVPDPTGCSSLNLIFSGYSAKSAKKTTDYRQVGQITLELGDSGSCAVVAPVSSSPTTASGTSSGTSTGAAASSTGAPGYSGTSGSATAAATGTSGSGGATSSATSTPGVSTSGAASSTASSGTTSGRVTTSSTGGTAPEVLATQVKTGCGEGTGESAWALLALVAAVGWRRRR